MNVFELMGIGFGTVLTPIGIALMFLGVFVGIIAGFVGAMGLVKKDNGIQAIYGPKADMLKSEINDIL